jgi:cytochrome c biogenesis protein CcmG/thiol:disulfide interchange protein DsbE
VVVNIWATWCAPCRAEHPLLVELAAEGVDILGVLYKDPDLDLARRLLAEEGDPFAWHVLDPAGDAFIAFGSTGVPETFLIDADGMIVKTLRGPLTEATRDEFLAAWRAAEAGAAG